jgi:hypothetical protein
MQRRQSIFETIRAVCLILIAISFIRCDIMPLLLRFIFPAVSLLHFSTTSLSILVPVLPSLTLRTPLLYCSHAHHLFVPFYFLHAWKSNASSCYLRCLTISFPVFSQVGNGCGPRIILSPLRTGG